MWFALLNLFAVYWANVLSLYSPLLRIAALYVTVGRFVYFVDICAWLGYTNQLSDIVAFGFISRVGITHYPNYVIGFSISQISFLGEFLCLINPNVNRGQTDWLI